MIISMSFCPIFHAEFHVLNPSEAVVDGTRLRGSHVAEAYGQTLGGALPETRSLGLLALSFRPRDTVYLSSYRVTAVSANLDLH